VQRLVTDLEPQQHEAAQDQHPPEFGEYFQQPRFRAVYR
jgi:hypothetical protein